MTEDEHAAFCRKNENESGEEDSVLMPAAALIGAIIASIALASYFARNVF